MRAAPFVCIRRTFLRKVACTNLDVTAPIVDTSLPAQNSCLASPQCHIPPSLPSRSVGGRPVPFGRVAGPFSSPCSWRSADTREEYHCWTSPRRGAPGEEERRATPGARPSAQFVHRERASGGAWQPRRLPHSRPRGSSRARAGAAPAPRARARASGSRGVP